MKSNRVPTPASTQTPAARSSPRGRPPPGVRAQAAARRAVAARSSPGECPPPRAFAQATARSSRTGRRQEHTPRPLQGAREQATARRSRAGRCQEVTRRQPPGARAVAARSRGRRPSSDPVINHLRARYRRQIPWRQWTRRLRRQATSSLPSVAMLDSVCGRGRRWAAAGAFGRKREARE
jgi:hypothetical protein